MIVKLPGAKSTGTLLSIGFLFFLSSCTKVDAGNGTKIDNRLEVSDFDKIVYEVGGVINYRQDTYTQVNVNTTQEAFNALDIYVDDKTLYIKRKSGYNIVNQDELVFDIVDDDAYSFYICGSGDIDADFKEGYYFQEHEFKISGSGSVLADEVNANEHTSKISGSGSISVDQMNTSKSIADVSGSGSIRFNSGYSQFSEVDIHGSGDFSAYDLNTEESEVFSCGSGTVYLRAQTLLDISLSGSGSVYYKGYPNISSSVSGSGDVYDAN